MPNPIDGFSAAIAATCAPGYRLENTNCVKCVGAVYCPGDDQMYPCPQTDWDLEHLTEYWYWSIDDLHQARAGCRVNWDYGSFYFSCAYEQNGYAADNEGLNDKCMLYALNCPAGYWCQECEHNGKQSYFWLSSHQNAADFECKPVGYGFYSAADSVTRTKCPNGTTTLTQIAHDVSDCVPLCGAGVTRLRSGNAAVPLFQIKYTTPALGVRLGGATCYGNLTPGHGPGVNIQYNGTMYHTGNF